MFKKIILPTLNHENIFEKLSQSVEFELVAKGRKGANLVGPDNSIVRTTTAYEIPNQNFSAVHYELIEQIKSAFPLVDIEFNNASIEIYDDNYKKMKFHSDQSLDLEEKSYICIYSCYTNPHTAPTRTLRVKEKTDNVSNYIPNSNYIDIKLEHNSVILFSTETNSKHLHQIICTHVHSNKQVQDSSNNLWLGLTCRLSKTFIYHQNHTAYITSNHQPLVQANQEQKQEFYKNRKLENSNIGFKYPDINYTISPGDLIPVIR